MVELYLATNTAKIIYLQVEIRMNTNNLITLLKSKQIWHRVVELNRRGFYKDPEKQILFGSPVPLKDIAPLRISLILTSIIVLFIAVLVIGLALDLLPVPLIIIISILILGLMLLPKLMISILPDDYGNSNHTGSNTK